MPRERPIGGTVQNVGPGRGAPVFLLLTSCDSAMSSPLRLTTQARGTKAPGQDTKHYCMWTLPLPSISHQPLAISHVDTGTVRSDDATKHATGMPRR